jgi:short-subunit dehydrogenase
MPKEQVVVITGASGGVGSALAAALANREAALCLIGRTPEKLRRVSANVNRGKQTILCYSADLASDEDIDKLANDLSHDLEHIDVIIHAAGTIALGRIEQAPVKDLDMQYRVNVRAPYILTQALLPLIRKRRGQVVFINSSAGLNARAGVSQYAATKSALKAMANSLREEVNDDGIRVLSVFLGRTATPMQLAVHAMEGRPYESERLIQPHTVASMIVHALTLERDAEVTDIYIRPTLKLAAS